MNVPIEEWAAAVPPRHSRRRFTGEPVTDGQAEALRTHCESFEPFPGARAVFVEQPAGDVFRGLVGSYGKIRGAPSILAFVADVEVPDHAAKLGYTAEAAVLEATRLALATCWVAGSFDRRLTASVVGLEAGERVFGVSPVGTAVPEKAGSERTVARLARSHVRKPLPEIAPGIDRGGWPMWAFEGVRLARLAPSAVNRQPWRFRMDDLGCVLATDAAGGDRGISKRLDCGIAMLHFELGALVTGGLGGWEFLEPPDVARYRLSPTTEEVPADGRP
ncbi:MAG TPA: nitroreductase family protein [Coriobacteriia bacterium]